MTLHQYLKGDKQYRVPIFQRHYEWSSDDTSPEANVKLLWQDIVRAIQRNRSHFIGPFVLSQVPTGPNAATSYQLIDGQQRTITFILLMAVLRDFSISLGDEKLASYISQTYLLNSEGNGDAKLRMLGSQTNQDRTILSQVIRNSKFEKQPHPIVETYNSLSTYIQHRINAEGEDPKLTLKFLAGDIPKRINLVTILLNREDNPVLIFQSLNARGRDLSNTDLSRSHLLMQFDSEATQKRLYDTYWKPMEMKLTSEAEDSDTILDEFLFAFLIRENGYLKESQIYQELVETAGTTEQAVEGFLAKINEHADYYCRLVNPSHEKDSRLRNALERFNRLGQRKLFAPIVLSAYSHATESARQNSQGLTFQQAIDIIELYESLYFRRMVVGKRNTHTARLFMNIYDQTRQDSDQGTFVEKWKRYLDCEEFPSNGEVKDALLERDLYGSGAAALRTRYLLERLEFDMRDPFEIFSIEFAQRVQIEHIMPQTLSPWWKRHLGNGAAARDVHQSNLHLLGNLTLTGHNAALSNEALAYKVQYYADSDLRLNKELAHRRVWRECNIRQRGRDLANRCLKIWKHPKYD